MMMTIDLKSYLKNWRTDLVAAAERKRVEAMDRALDAETIEADIADLERAIAALEPAPEAPAADKTPPPEAAPPSYSIEAGHGTLRNDAPRSAAPGSQAGIDTAQDPGETPIPEGFVAWGGGERPVDAAQLVEIMYANGMRSYGVAENAWWQWQRPGDYRGIIAYRLLPPTETADETPEPVATLPEEGEVKLLRGERLYFEEEGWVPVDEFEFPKSEAIVECRWDDGFCETFEFVGYTPATNEPHWRSTRYESTEADQVITHYRSFAKAEQPQGPSPVGGEGLKVDESWFRHDSWFRNMGEPPAWEYVDLRFRSGYSIAGARPCDYRWGESAPNTVSDDDIMYYRRWESAKPAPVNSTSAETETVQGENTNPEPVGEDA